MVWHIYIYLWIYIYLDSLQKKQKKKDSLQKRVAYMAVTYFRNVWNKWNWDQRINLNGIVIFQKI